MKKLVKVLEVLLVLVYAAMYVAALIASPRFRTFYLFAIFGLMLVMFKIFINAMKFNLTETKNSQARNFLIYCIVFFATCCTLIIEDLLIPAAFNCNILEVTRNSYIFSIIHWVKSLL